MNHQYYRGYGVCGINDTVNTVFLTKDYKVKMFHPRMG
jgi:hypothetical protein